MSQCRLVDAGFFVFRAPLLPVAAFQQLYQEPRSALQSAERAHAAQWSPPLDRPELRTAIALQSPSFWKALSQAREKPTADADSQMALPLYRYTARAALRCTPRGLFAAAGIGTIGRCTNLRFRSDAGGCVRVDLSLDYLNALLRHQMGSQLLRRGIRFVANPTLISYGDTMTLSESSDTGHARGGCQVALQVSPLLRRVVRLLGSRPLSAARVRSVLAAAGVPAEQRDLRITEMLAAQVIVPAGGADPISSDPVGRFIGALPRVGPFAQTRRALSAVHARRHDNWGSPREFSLQALESLRGALPPVPGFENANRVFQVEMHWDEPGVALNRSVITDLSKAIERMHLAFGDLHSGRLNSFVDAFADRFGEATVPLMRLLDPERGLGDCWSAPSAPRWAMRGRRQAMLGLLHRALERGERAVELDETFWSAISPESVPDFPPAASAICRVIAGSSTGVDIGSYEVLLDCVAGTSGTEHWARHSRLNDRIQRHHAQIRRRLAEASIDGVLADVACTPPQGADIMARPAMGRLRIDCSGARMTSHGEALPVNELFIQIRNGRVRLLSKRLKREIVPVIGSAVDPGTVSSAAFGFLALLASQHTATPLSWDWGELSESAFLPRVCYGRVILAPARWRIGVHELRSLGPPQPEGDATCRWARWRAARRLPRWVSIVDGEETLGCDLHRHIGLEMLLKEVMRKGFATLDELRVEPGELCATDGVQPYSHELIVPFIREVPGTARPRRRRSAGNNPATWAAKFGEGVRLPGSDWIYAKLYASPRCIQSMLRTDVPALLASLCTECQVQKWFFFRYEDTDWHLRLRLRVPGRERRARALELIGAACRSLLAKETVWRLQYDTYFREIERFGGSQACGLVERLFSAESDLALAALDAWKDDEAYIANAMRLSVGWVLWVWTRLGLDLAAVARLSRATRSRMLREKHVSPSHHGASFRAGRHEPVQGLEREEPWKGCTRIAGRALGQLRLLASEQRLGVGLHELAGDLSHLFVNRLFATAHAEREYDLYWSLQCHAYSEMSRRGERVE